MRPARSRRQFATEMQTSVRHFGRSGPVASEVGRTPRPGRPGAAQLEYSRCACCFVGQVDESRSICATTPLKNADWGAVDQPHAAAGNASHLSGRTLQLRRGRLLRSRHSAVLIGDTDTIARELARISAAGFAGCTFSFVDYVQEFPYFPRWVLPRLERLVLRNVNQKSGNDCANNHLRATAEFARAGGSSK